MRTHGTRVWGGGFGAALAFLSYLSFATSVLFSQDLDVVLYAGDRSSRTMIDGIDDPIEQEAFEKLRSTEDQVEKRVLAEAFLEEYPRSWLTPFVLAMAAKAAVAQNDLEAGLEYGKRSLRILPENGTLLAIIANVQVQRGLLDEASKSAADALEYLDRFQGPAQYADDEWDRVKRELSASAHFVLGRVKATLGLRATGAERVELLNAAREALHRSLELNKSDGIATFLLGIVAEEIGNASEARSAFATALRIPSPVQDRALERLRQIHSDQEPARSSFQEFHAKIPPLGLKTGAERPRPAREDSFGAYAGSAACQGCHREIFDAWSRTGMARMFRPYAPENVMGDFVERNEYRDADGDLLGRMVLDDGRHFIELQGKGGFERFPVDYTIGSKWQQAYGTRLPDGRIHVMPIQYNRLHGEWVNFWEVLDDGPSERSIISNFHRMELVTSYQMHCAACHTSQVQAEGLLIEPERITFREPGINCEMCHGPSRAHADAWLSGEAPSTDPATPPLRFADLDHRSYVKVCAECHMQSGVVQAGPRGEINYSGKHKDFLSRRRQRPYEEYSRSAFYKDGRFRETTFIVEAFSRSQCFRVGQVHCGHCHDPHPMDSADNPTSLKFRDNPNQMCVQCHESYADEIESHTRHPADSEASLCTACHMPKIMNSMMFLAGTHRIDDIPDAEMTRHFGQAESPNACLECHESQSTDWLAESLSDWH